MVRPVIITRPAAQAGELASRVTALGREAVLFPLLEIHPLHDQAPLRAALDELERYSLVAFVSPNAIDAAFSARPDWPAGMTLAVVGEGSRMALARHGIHDGNATILRPLDSRRSDSEGLLAALDKSLVQGRDVLIIRGESGRELLGDALRAAGARVTAVAAYRRCAPLPDGQRRAQLAGLIETPGDWIVTSSEAMRNLVEMVEQAGGGAAVAKMQQQHLLLPHSRIVASARMLGFMNITETGSGDEGLLAALQFRP